MSDGILSIRPRAGRLGRFAGHRRQSGLSCRRAVRPCGWFVASCGWSVASCGWFVASCGPFVASCGWFVVSSGPSYEISGEAYETSVRGSALGYQPAGSRITALPAAITAMTN